MRLSHLALAVRDQERFIAFYATYFGFDPSSARRYPDGVIIVKNADGFALALGQDRSPERAAGFPHFGFDPDSPDESVTSGRGWWRTRSSSWRTRTRRPTSGSSAWTDR